MYVLHGTKDSSLTNFKMCEISVKIRVYGYNKVVMIWRQSRHRRWLFRQQIRKNLQRTISTTCRLKTLLI